MKISTIIGAVSTALLMAASASAYEFTPIDWSAQSGTVTLDSGKCYLVTEADMPYVNALTLKISGTLVFSNATADVRASVSSGAGTIVKMGASTQSFKWQVWQFSGTFRIEEGKAVYANAYAFGDSSRSGNVYVSDGATAELNASYCFAKRALHIAGTGVDGAGAVVIKHASSTIQKLYLDGDAKIGSTVANDLLEYHIDSGSGRFGTVNPAILELNGHKLTFGGTSTRIGFNDVSVSDSVGTGEIVFEPLDGGVRLVRFQGTSMACAVPITLEGNSKIRFYNSCAPIPAPVTAKGSLTFDYGCDSGKGAGLTDAYNNWTGDIIFTTADSVLGFAPSAANHQITVSGVVSGPAGLQVGSSGTPASGIVRLKGHNTYTGASEVWGTSDLVVLVDKSDSIADPTKLSVHGGMVVPYVASAEEGGYTWTPSQYLDYVAPQVSDGAKVPFCTTAITADDFTFTSALIAEKLASATGLIWSVFGDDGRLSFAGEFTEDTPLNLNIPAGTVRLTGDDTINLGSVLVTGTSASQSGTLLLDNAKDVVYTNQTINLGSLSASISAPVARMIVSNSTIRSTYHVSYKDVETGALHVGRHATGVLEVENGSVVSNKLVLGGGKSFYEGEGVGAVYQRGGTVAPLSGGEGHLNSNIGNAGHGYYELSGGRFRPTSGVSIGGYHCGIFLQTGGESIHKSMSLAGANGGTCYYTVLGGTTKMVGKTGDYTAVMGNGGHLYVTVQGKDSFFSIADSNYGIVYNCSNANQDDTAVYNLNDGGVFECAKFLLYKDSYKSTYPLIINFNGGILRSCGGYERIFCEGALMPKVAVYEKGIQVDDAGVKALNNLYVPLEGIREGGIQSIALPEGGVSGFYAAPRVDIAGDGAGASAIALVDSRTATVTNILVTSHGWGYSPTNTTVTLRYYTTKKYTVPAENVVVGDNEIGGFTKLGSKVFSLYCTNTFARWTRVMGGTLKAMCDKAIPSGTYLTLSNDATLDLNNVSDATFTGMDGTGGTVANGIVKIVGEWKISAKKFIDRETTVLKGTLDLTACTKIVLTDTDVLDGAAEQLKRLELFKTTSTTWPENLVIEGVPQGWSLKQTATGLKLGFDHGALLIVR